MLLLLVLVWLSCQPGAVGLKIFRFRRWSSINHLLCLLPCLPYVAMIVSFGRHEQPNAAAAEDQHNYSHSHSNNCWALLCTSLLSHFPAAANPRAISTSESVTVLPANVCLDFPCLTTNNNWPRIIVSIHVHVFIQGEERAARECWTILPYHD